MKLRFALLFGLSLLVTASPRAQNNAPVSLDIGGTTVSIGMPRQEVIAKLEANFTLKADSDSSISVWSKTPPPFDLYGSLSFDTKGLLVYANRTWEPDNTQEGVPTLEALQNALSQLTTPTASGSKICRCTILLKETPSPGGVSRKIYVSNGTRRLEIATFRLSKPIEGTDRASSIIEVIEK